MVIIKWASKGTRGEGTKVSVWLDVNGGCGSEENPRCALWSAERVLWRRSSSTDLNWRWQSKQTNATGLPYANSSVVLAAAASAGAAAIDGTGDWKAKG